MPAPPRATPGVAAALPGSGDTIVALATPAGRGAIAVVRLSGPAALSIAAALGAPPLVPRRATLVALRHPDDGEVLDRALVTAFPAPRSYTGEDVVECATHGGPLVARGVLQACVAAGAREALPGEFTRRAVLHGKLDLLQAEAIGELVAARTTAMRRAALAQADGGLTRRCAALREGILGLEALIAYDLDFPEEDDGPLAPDRVPAAGAAVLRQLDALLATAPRGVRLRDGALVVIAGPPNAGKSSLFNALLGEARALVTPVAGTTRDAIEAVLDTPGVPLRLADTAGLRATDDLVERLGIEVSERYLRAADLVLACGETAAAAAETARLVRTLSEAPVLPVRTKGDLRAAADGTGAHGWADVAAGGAVPLVVSAETGEGLGALLEAMQEAVGAALATAPERGADAADGVVLLRERQRVGLATARAEVAQFLSSWGSVPAPVAAVHLHAAVEALDALVGRVSVDDVLDRVFRDFCVGK